VKSTKTRLDATCIVQFRLAQAKKLAAKAVKSDHGGGGGGSSGERGEGEREGEDPGEGDEDELEEAGGVGEEGVGDSEPAGGVPGAGAGAGLPNPSLVDFCSKDPIEKRGGLGRRGVCDLAAIGTHVPPSPSRCFSTSGAGPFTHPSIFDFCFADLTEDVVCPYTLHARGDASGVFHVTTMNGTHLCTREGTDGANKKQESGISSDSLRLLASNRSGTLHVDGACFTSLHSFGRHWLSSVHMFHDAFTSGLLSAPVDLKHGKKYAGVGAIVRDCGATVSKSVTAKYMKERKVADAGGAEDYKYVCLSLDVFFSVPDCPSHSRT
jgi:hypothetical protein